MWVETVKSGCGSASAHIYFIILDYNICFDRDFAAAAAAPQFTCFSTGALARVCTRMQTTQELLAALRASEVAAGAGGAQEYEDWGAQGSWAGERDLPPSEQERDIIFQIREAGFWELTEVELLLLLLSCVFCAVGEVGSSRVRAPAQKETNERGRETAGKGGRRDGECGCVIRYMCGHMHALGACVRACVHALVQDVVLKLLRRNQGKAELAVNALIGNQFYGPRRAVDRCGVELDRCGVYTLDHTRYESRVAFPLSRCSMFTQTHACSLYSVLLLFLRRRRLGRLGGRDSCANARRARARAKRWWRLEPWWRV